MGAIYRLPFIVASNFEDCLEKVKGAGVKLVATHTKAMKSYEQENYQEATGFLIGNESGGLTREAFNLAQEWVRIPMKEQVESLNVAIATGILVYEAYRQRGLDE